MHLELSAEALLVQLGYHTSTQMIQQMNDIVANTEGIERFMPHIPSFNDALAVEKGFVAMSNSDKYLKIKCDVDVSADNLTGFHELLEHWEEKYKLNLKKVKNKNTYYLLGLL
jgi:hypothetical protein